jgi:hypothetical protein
MNHESTSNDAQRPIEPNDCVFELEIRNTVAISLDVAKIADVSDCIRPSTMRHIEGIIV